MPAVDVLALDEYRDRRHSRRRLTHALYAGDPVRSRVLSHLASIAEITESDRVAVVWVDEFAPRQAHPWLVLDLLCDRPRLSFSVDPLQRAWDRGIPGTEEMRDTGGVGRSPGLWIALGSDGARGWFVVADTVTGRRPLCDDRRSRALFLAGECSAVVLHRDMDRQEGAHTLPGERYLRELEGRETDEEHLRRVQARFAVGRLIESLLEDDLCISVERALDGAQRAEAELERLGVGGGDAEALAPVLHAYRERRPDRLADAILSLGGQAEAEGHTHAAEAAYDAGFRIAVRVCDTRLAVNAARSLGRLERRSADWASAETWYRRALDIAEAAGLDELAARVLSGLALVKRDVGNLPAAREWFGLALERAEEAGERDTLASVHHDLMGLEQQAGDFPQALRHGWRAANTYTTELQRVRCMAGLGGALLESGALTSAEDAFAVVARTATEHYYLLYAADALGHIAALRGDGAAYDRLSARTDELGWESGPAYVKAEIFCFRGLSCIALGRRRAARAWLERGIAWSEEHGFNLVLFRCEEALGSLDAPGKERSVPSRASEPVATPPEVSQGLRSMRMELVGAGA